MYSENKGQKQKSNTIKEPRPKLKRRFDQMDQLTTLDFDTLSQF